MPISIRKPEVETLARRLAGINGCTMTEAIERALEEQCRIAEGGREPRLKRLAGIAARCAALPDLDTRTTDDILGYGKDGLP